MFKKLRLKLVLINVISVGIIIAFILAGIYIVLERNMDRQAVTAMRSFAINGRDFNRPVPPEFRKYESSIFFVKLDIRGIVVETSNEVPIPLKDLQGIVDKLNPSVDRGFVNYNKEVYKYMRSDRNGLVYVFLDVQVENELLARLVGTYVVVGLLALLLVLICSFFLAERALVPIRKSWEKQKNFIADASHELRSPLTVIRTNLELVMGNGNETVESQRKWLDSVKDESIRMSNMVNDMLLLARADANQEVMEKTSFELSEVLKSAFDSLETVAASKNLRYEVDLGADGIFLGDERHIKQLVTILLDNAMKYTEDGGNVKLLLEAEHEHYTITVADSGIGIPEEHISRVFERFYRVDKARSRNEDGTGLGLAIADWIVKEHKGTIKIVSVVGEGTRFIVSLPKGK